MILIDTGPLVALCDARDTLHGRAVQDLQTLVHHPFATCEAVIAEAAFHLPAAPQRARLRALLDEVLVSFLPVAADSRARESVWDWLQTYAEREPDWADGCLLVLCGLHPAARVWTYDREFGTIWRTPQGRRPLLAVA